jgi:hypothetical protein
VGANAGDSEHQVGDEDSPGEDGAGHKAGTGGENGSGGKNNGFSKDRACEARNGEHQADPGRQAYDVVEGSPRCEANACEGGGACDKVTGQAGDGG